jgi:hypothetical protein
MVMFVGAVTVPLLLLALCAPPGHPIIAEVFYDAVGDDTGHEFVEIFNPSPGSFALAGARLEAGDGAGDGRWTLRWVGSPGDTIAAGGRFVVGGGLVAPTPEAVVQLDLQNGPDAVRLVWPDGAVEVVGYGAHTLAEYFCGAPAADVPSGQSLGRVPDDSDLGSNAQDFRAATPSPATANLPGHDAALIVGSLAITPEQPTPFADVALSGALQNHGAEPIAEREVELSVGEVQPVGETPLASAFVEAQLQPGDTARYAIRLPGLAAGKRRLHVRARLAGDASSANDDDSLLIRVGAGPLEVTEIQFHPTSGEGEWVEVKNRAAAPLALVEFSVADRRGAPGLPAGGDGPLAAESLAVFAQDRLALLARFPALDAARVWEVKPWGSLNNSDDTSGVADVVTVRETDGTLCDRVAYSAVGVPAGVPLERRDGAWAPAADPFGSPLAPPRPLPPLASRFAVSPRRLAASGSRTTRIGWDLPWPRGRIAVDLYDLGGRRVTQVLSEIAVTARGERAWSAADLPPGLYLLAMVAHAEGGAETMTLTQPLRVEGSAP